MPLLIFRAARDFVRLEEDIRDLRRRLEGLELEWGDVYDKLRKAMGRIVKSRAIIEAREDGKEEAATPGDGAQSPSGHLLTPRQLTIQQQILRRRAGL